MLSTQIGELASGLKAAADETKRRWWTNYVKGALFLGVPMAQTRAIALDWYQNGESPDPVGLCLQLGSNPISEVKLAGIAIMEHDLVPSGVMSIRDLERVREALNDGGYNDWNTCDWLCVKVIGKLVGGGARADHDGVLAWTSSDVLWEKRAGLVGFVNHLPHTELSAGFDRAFLAATATVVSDQRRFAQTAAGWTLRELSHRRPEMVRSFVDSHGPSMSAEAQASATKLLHD
jgi:3-methyladenine DNA glycosylase AlkD